MRRRNSVPARAARLLASALCLLGVAARDAGPNDAAGHLGRVHIEDGLIRTAVQSAIRGAQQRLRREKCQRVFTDFTDASGRPLRERLTALQQTGDGYLERLYWVDRSRTPQCERNPRMNAYTAVGGRVVYVCGERLARGRPSERRSFETIVIHEALHTLGLGENPPTSVAITEQVRFRCAE